MANVSQIGSYGIYNEIAEASNLVDVLAPVGAIIPYNPGYYTSSSNAGFQVAGPASNDIAGINAFLPGNWRVADGTAVNNSKSPIWVGASRFLPDLTGNRFIRGATATGAVGGGTATLTALNIPQVSTTYTPAGTTDVGHTHLSSNVTYNKQDWNTNQTAHAHNSASSGAQFVCNGTGGTGANVTTGGGGYVLNITATNTASWTNTVINGTAAGQTLGTTNRNLTGTSATITVGTAPGSLTPVSIVPTYLSTFYIIRIY